MKEHAHHQMDHCSMSMEGIPTWMAAAGVVVIILVTHLGLKWFRGAPDSSTCESRDLLRISFFKWFVKRSYFPLLIQSVSVLLLLLVVATGLFGETKGNIAPVLTWTWWWILLIFLVLGFGKVFCSVCPWEAVASLITSLSLKSRIKKITYSKPFPRWARNIYPAIFLFIGLTWAELGMNITHSPPITALLGLLMLFLAVTFAVTFEKRAFCRYSCPVGRISGLYAMFSPMELRAANTEVCRTCEGQECYRGSTLQTGCPTNLFPGSLTENTYCTLCTECVRACPHDNLAFNLRSFGADLLKKTRFQWDESILAIVLLALTSFHGLTMTPVWQGWNGFLRAYTGLGPIVVFTALMILMLLAPLALFWAGARVAAMLAGESGVSTGRIFKVFAYAVIPVALFYHLAHNCMHFFMEAGNLIPLLSDPFGYGWNLFGTAGETYGAMLSLGTIWWLQIAFVVIGHIYGVVVSDRLADKLFHDKSQAKLALLPLLFTMILYSCFSVWLIAQPMDMRSSGM